MTAGQGSGTWHNSTAPGYTQWTWKGDTSRCVGQSHVRSWANGPHWQRRDHWTHRRHGHAARCRRAERYNRNVLCATVEPTPGADISARAKNIVLNIVSYIMENNWTLIDVTGKRTTWGFWDPADLNYNPVHYRHACTQAGAGALARVKK
jgi:hypothetical protein